MVWPGALGGAREIMRPPARAASGVAARPIKMPWENRFRSSRSLISCNPSGMLKTVVAPRTEPRTPPQKKAFGVSEHKI